MSKSMRETLGLPETATEEQVKQRQRDVIRARELFTEKQIEQMLARGRLYVPVKSTGEQAIKATDKLGIKPEAKVGGKTKLKEVKPMIDIAKGYPYLASEDKLFCLVIRCSEDDYLKMHGGLAKYNQFKENRAAARSAGIDIPQLPSTFADLDKFAEFDLTAEQIGASLVSDARTTVQGAADAQKLNKRMSEQQARDATNAEIVKSSRLKALREECAAMHTVAADSQYAKDWADGQYKIRWGK